MRDSEARFVIYGYRLSYATRKLEFGLRLLGAPFVMEALAWERRRALERLAGADTVPVVRLPDLTWLAGANDALDWADARASAPLGGREEHGLLIALLEAWHDEWAWRTALHWRWNKPRAWSLASDAFAREALPDGPPQLIEPVAALYADWGARALRARGLFANAAAAAAADSLLVRWLEALEAQLASTPYLLGERATRADVAVLGLLRAHFVMDPESSAVLLPFERTRAWLDGDHRPAQGPLAPWTEPTPFARFVLSEANGAFAAYLGANAVALAEQARNFELEADGTTLQCLTRQELEAVRLELIARVLRLEPASVARLLHDAPALAGVLHTGAASDVLRRVG